MSWKYLLIGLVIGVISSIIIICFGNWKICRQQFFEKELKKCKMEFYANHKELNKYFSRTIELLDDTINNYCKFYQYIIKNSKNLLIDHSCKKSIFHYFLMKKKIEQDQDLAKIQPRDYSEKNIFAKDIRK